MLDRIIRMSRTLSIPAAAILLAGSFAFGIGGHALAQSAASAPGNVASSTEGWIDANGDVDMPAILASLDPDVRAYMAHITTLANPFFEGRAPGTKGNRFAAEYIEFWFRHFGLQPAFPEYDSEGNAVGDGSHWISYRQPFDMPGGMEAVRQELTFADASGTLAAFEPGREVSALGVGDGAAGGPMTFVGYGIASGPGGQNHYGEIDLKGRIAVMLGYEPSDETGRSLWNGGRDGWSDAASLQTKLIEAARKGAAGVIVINPPGTRDPRTHELLTAEQSTWRRVGVPVVQVSLAAGDRLLRAAGGRSLAEFKRLADADSFAATHLNEVVTAGLNVELRRTRNPTDNVGGVIRGHGRLKDEWIIIGAHYDHVGYGFFGSNGGRAATGTIHPGADDNGSGTSAVLLLAQRLSEEYAKMPADTDARSILLMAFSAEESGLNGSRHYTRKPTLTSDQVNIMLNLDMVGRLRNNSVEVSGIGSATGLADVVKPFFDSSGMRVVSQQSGSGPSDHASFNNVGIPVLFFFTGLHPQYHRPADVASLINPVGAVKIARLAERLALHFASMPEKLEFQRTGGGFRLDMLDQPPEAAAGGAGEDAAPAQPMVRSRVRLGIQPNYNAETTGVLLDGVTEGTPAAAAGLKAGDLILSWNGAPVNDIRALMTELGKHKPGDKIRLGVKRSGEMIWIEVTLAQPAEEG